MNVNPKHLPRPLFPGGPTPPPPTADPTGRPDQIPLPEEPPELDDSNVVELHPNPDQHHGGQPVHRRLGDIVVDELRSIVRAFHSLDADTIRLVVDRLRAPVADLLWEELDPEQQARWHAVLDLLEFEAGGVFAGGRVSLDLDYLPALKHTPDPAVRSELEAIRASEPVPDIDRGLWALLERVQREASRASADRLIGLISRGAPRDELLREHRERPIPSLRDAEETATWMGSPSEWQARESAMSIASKVHISSGHFLLDRALQSPDEAPGAFSAGTFTVMVAPSGTGKTSFSTGLPGPMAMDLRHGWGLPHAQVIYAITEEEPHERVRHGDLGLGQLYESVADQIQIARIGSSLERLAKTIYLRVAQAEDDARDTGLPVAHHAPIALIVDHIHGIAREGQDDTSAVKATANFLKAVMQFDLEGMAEFAGVSYTDVTKRRPPVGLVGHRVAVVGFAQVRKTDAAQTGFDPDNRHHTVGKWMKSLGGKPVLNPEPGDVAMVDDNDMKGSSTLKEHLTASVIMYRPAPNAPLIKDADDKVIDIADRRAYLYIEKARTGAGMRLLPMDFGPTADGYRGRWYDEVSASAALEGLMELPDYNPDPTLVQLPVRGARHPFEQVTYKR